MRIEIPRQGKWYRMHGISLISFSIILYLNQPSNIGALDMLIWNVMWTIVINYIMCHQKNQPENLV